jgi:hypothetical protein
MCWQVVNIIEAVESRLATLPGVARTECRIDPGIEWTPDMMARSAQARLRQIRPIAS